MSTPTPVVELPEKYYLDYFEYLLRFVEKLYGPLLRPAELLFIADYRELPEPARCLFVRMTNRRGCFFRVARFDYREVPDLDEALDALLEAGFAELLGPPHADRAAECLGIFKKSELIDWLAETPDEARTWKALRKPELLAALSERDPAALLDAMARREVVVCCGHGETVGFLKFLFFGNLDFDMEQFVVRDLGNARGYELDEDKMVPQFQTRREAEDKLLMLSYYQQFRQVRDDWSAEQLATWFAARAPGCARLSAAAQPTFTRLCLRLGRLLERRRAYRQALNVYARTEEPPARERRARLLYRLKETDAARTLCEQMATAPHNAEERIFAVDFARRLGTPRARRAPLISTTAKLKAAESVVLDPTFRYQVEVGVMHHFGEQGYQALFSENYLWRSLFGLVCWDVIFDQDVQLFHNPFQRVPSDLFTPEFLANRRPALHQALRRLDRKRDFFRYLDRMYDQHAGTHVPLVGWHEDLPQLLKTAREKLRPAQLKAVLLEMAGHLRENARGFPDLFVWTDQDYEFIEVKSPNDQLSAQQLHWLRFFQQQGIRARVLRVAWADA